MKKMCSLAWTGLYNEANGIVKPCCLFQDSIKDENGTPYRLQTSTVKEIFDSQYMIDLRTKFVNGDDIPECNTCWVNERNGYKSKREMYLKSEEKLNTMGMTYTQVSNVTPNDYQLIISNACNLACRSCSPSHSSMWQAINKRTIGITNYDMPHGQVASQNSLFWANREEWINTVSNLEMVGGEPFFISKWEEVIDELIASGRAAEITINFSTNLTLYREDLLMKMLDNFKIVSMSFSLDGIGSVQEYIRPPESWSIIESNLFKYKTLIESRKFKARLITQICHTVSWYNVLFVPEFLAYCEANVPNIKVWVNLVHYPNHMSAVNAPEALKVVATSKILAIADTSRYKVDLTALVKFIQSVVTPDSELENARQFITTQDEARDQKMSNMIPEVFAFIS